MGDACRLCGAQRVRTLFIGRVGSVVIRSSFLYTVVLANVSRVRIWVVELVSALRSGMAFGTVAVRRRLEICQLFNPFRKWASSVNFSV